MMTFMRGKGWHEACLVVLGLLISAGVTRTALAGAELADTQTLNGTTIETLSLGSGLSASIGVMLTPLWFGEHAGFGAGGFAGVKYDGLDNGPGGSVTMTRFPVGGALHVLLRSTVARG